MQVCAIRRDVGQSMEDDLALLGGPDILDKVLERSDYVVVSMPASPQTVGWIGEPQLRRMKPSASSSTWRAGRSSMRTRFVMRSRGARLPALRLTYGIAIRASRAPRLRRRARSRVGRV